MIHTQLIPFISGEQSVSYRLIDVTRGRLQLKQLKAVAPTIQLPGKYAHVVFMFMFTLSVAFDVIVAFQFV